MSNWSTVILGDVCSPKQWKTISTNMLLENGYPVYGANGRIGYYNKYTHKNPTILITCRGATCGSITICEPFSYVNGNAMALDNLSPNFNINFLALYLKNRQLKDVITGSAQPQIIRQNLIEIEVPLIPLSEQLKIAQKMNRIDILVVSRKKQLLKLDELIKARFIEMFGDPTTNLKNWEIKPLSNHLRVVGGYAFNSDGYANNGIPILRIGNINTGLFSHKNLVFWHYDENLSRYLLHPNDIVISLTGTVGKDDYANVCILGNDYNEYYLNQRNAKLELKPSLNCYYLANILRFPKIKGRLTGISRGVRQANISNNDIIDLQLPIAPMYLQNQFAAFVQEVEKMKTKIQASLTQLETLYNALMQQYFG